MPIWGTKISAGPAVGQQADEVFRRPGSRSGRRCRVTCLAGPRRRHQARDAGLGQGLLQGRIPQRLDARRFGGDPAEIVPHPAHDLPTAGRGHIRENPFEVDLGAPRKRQQRAEGAPGEAADRRGGRRRHEPHQAQEQERPARLRATRISGNNRAAPRGGRPSAPHASGPPRNGPTVDGNDGPEWCPGAESNHRHRDFQSRALPTELPGLRCGTTAAGKRIGGPARRTRLIGLSPPQVHWQVHPQRRPLRPDAPARRAGFSRRRRPIRRLPRPNPRFVVRFLIRLFGRDTVVLIEPPPEIDVGAAARTERPVGGGRRLAANRAAHGSDPPSRRPVRALPRAQCRVTRRPPAGPRFRTAAGRRRSNRSRTGGGRIPPPCPGWHSRRPCRCHSPLSM